MTFPLFIIPSIGHNFILCVCVCVCVCDCIPDVAHLAHDRRGKWRSRSVEFCRQTVQVDEVGFLGIWRPM